METKYLNEKPTTCNEFVLKIIFKGRLFHLMSASPKSLRSCSASVFSFRSRFRIRSSGLRVHTVLFFPFQLHLFSCVGPGFSCGFSLGQVTVSEKGVKRKNKRKGHRDPV